MPAAAKEKQAILAKFNKFARMMAEGPLPEDAIIADLSVENKPKTLAKYRKLVTEEANRLIYDQGDRHTGLKYELMEIIEMHFAGQS